MLKAAILFAATVFGADVLLEDFSNPRHTWKEMNDPVMGGKSVGATTFADSHLIFNGTVVDVPSLKAPGFITTRSMDKNAWADASHCKALSITAKSNTDYTGYRVSFGTKGGLAVCGKFFAYGYKAPFMAPLGKFGTIVIPFTDFSDCWDDATGDLIKTCESDSRFCPSASVLKNMETMTFWGEGVGGAVSLEVADVSATNCSSS